MSTTSGSKAKTSAQPAMSRELKSVGHKKVGGILQERSGSQLNKKTSTPTSSGKKNDPKQQSLFGFKGFAQISKEASNKKAFDVFSDENAVSSGSADQKPDNLQHRHSQTDITGDYASVVGDGDLAFYKELAERRREALNDSLKENESLVSENAELKCRNYELDNENQSLLESVEKANRLAEMLEPLFSNADEEEKEEGSSADSPEDVKQSGEKPAPKDEEGNPQDDEDVVTNEAQNVEKTGDGEANSEGEPKDDGEK